MKKKYKSFLSSLLQRTVSPHFLGISYMKTFISVTNRGAGNLILVCTHIKKTNTDITTTMNNMKNYNKLVKNKYLKNIK